MPALAAAIALPLPISLPKLIDVLSSVAHNAEPQTASRQRSVPPSSSALGAHNAAQRVRGPSFNSFGDLALDAVEEGDDEECEEGSNSEQRHDPSSSALVADSDGGVAGLSSSEEVDAAVKQGWLPEDYRTQICRALIEAGACSARSSCVHAHSLEELRTEAAVQAGKLPKDFRTSFCEEAVAGGSCAKGLLCHGAHTVRELRVVAAIEQGKLAQEYKTELCPDWPECHAALECHMAQGTEELRREAAVMTGKHNDKYKTRLCTGFTFKHRCTKGARCEDAHGAADLRREAAVRLRILNEKIKTDPCPDGERCTDQAACKYHHTRLDQMPKIFFKERYCRIWQETGYCAMGPECFWAHGIEELSLDVSQKLPHQVRQRRADDLAERASLGSMADTRSLDSFQSSKGTVRAAKRNKLRASRLENLRHNGQGPLAVQAGLMPAKAQADKGKGKRPHRGRGLGDARHLQLCPVWVVKGLASCGDPRCPHAHSNEELRTRVAKAEGQQEVAALMQLSSQTKRLMRKHKLEAAVSQFLEVAGSMDWDQARQICQACDCNLERAVQAFFSEAVPWDHMDAQVDLQEDLALVRVSAEALGVPLDDVDAAICAAGGSWQAAMQEFEDRASPSAGARPLPPAQPKPHTTNFEEYDPAAFGQDVPPGSSYQPQPATAEVVPAWAGGGGGDPSVEQQRLLLEHYQKLAMERNQAKAGALEGNSYHASEESMAPPPPPLPCTPQQPKHNYVSQYEPETQYHEQHQDYSGQQQARYSGAALAALQQQQCYGGQQQAPSYGKADLAASPDGDRHQPANGYVANGYAAYGCGQGYAAPASANQQLGVEWGQPQSQQGTLAAEALYHPQQRAFGYEHEYQQLTDAVADSYTARPSKQSVSNTANPFGTLRSLQ